jgi:hypothetical protein
MSATGQARNGQRPATLNATEAERRLITVFQTVQAAAKQRQRMEAEDEDAATTFSTEGYLIGERLNPNRAALLQNAAALQSKAAADSLPGDKTAEQLKTIADAIAAYAKATASAAEQEQEAEADRIARDRLLRKINSRRMAIQHAADGLWPYTLEACASIEPQALDCCGSSTALRRDGDQRPPLPIHPGDPPAQVFLVPKLCSGTPHGGAASLRGEPVGIRPATEAQLRRGWHSQAQPGQEGKNGPADQGAGAPSPQDTPRGEGAPTPCTAATHNLELHLAAGFADGLGDAFEEGVEFLVGGRRGWGEAGRWRGGGGQRRRQEGRGKAVEAGEVFFGAGVERFAGEASASAGEGERFDRWSMREWKAAMTRTHSTFHSLPACAR